MKKHINVSLTLAILGWGLIYTAIVAGTGFYYGSENQAKAQAHIDQTVKQAVKAVVPVPPSKN